MLRLPFLNSYIHSATALWDTCAYYGALCTTNGKKCSFFQNGAQSWTRIEITGILCEEEISPEFKLTHHAVSKR